MTQIKHALITPPRDHPLKLKVTFCVRGVWPEFCANVAALPLDETSTFIRARRGGQYGQGRGLNSELGKMAPEVKECAPAQR